MKKDKVGQILENLLDLAPHVKNSVYNSCSNNSFDLTYKQFFCLIILKNVGKITMSSLAEKFGVSNQHLSKLIDAIASKEYAKKTVNPLSKREVFVEITKNGVKYLDLVKTKHINILAEKLGKLSDEDVDELLLHTLKTKEILNKLKEV